MSPIHHGKIPEEAFVHVQVVFAARRRPVLALLRPWGDAVHALKPVAHAVVTEKGCEVRAAVCDLSGGSEFVAVGKK